MGFFSCWRRTNSGVFWFTEWCAFGYRTRSEAKKMSIGSILYRVCPSTRLQGNFIAIAGTICGVLLPATATDFASAGPVKNVAAIVTIYRHNSHADVIVSRLLQTDTLDGKGKNSPLKLASLYTDQRPADDMSRPLAASHGFRISQTIEDALTLGTGRLAVDGVLLIAEHGDYLKSATGNVQYPKRRFWEETLKVF